MKCLVVVPAFPTAVNGVYDFAQKLIEVLSIPNHMDFQLIQVNSASRNALDKLFLPFSLIHLHYVGYGYAHRGTPVNLIYALKKWKIINNNRLVITFHELFASSSLPWKSSFYLGVLQKFLFTHLEKLADFSVVSCHAFASNFIGNVVKMPVFSNFNAPTIHIPFEQRADSLIIWGNVEVKQRAYIFLEKFYPTIVSHWKIEKILDIGVKFSLPPSFPVPIVHCGFLPPSEISSLLSSCKMALFIAYSPAYFSKSGIFAAFASHQMAVLVAPSQNDYFANLDGLYSAFHFQQVNELEYQSAALLASQLHSWYLTHTLTNHALSIYSPWFVD